MCSYQRFQYIHVWLHTKSWKKTFLSLSFTSFQSSRNIQSYKDYFNINGKQRIKIPKKSEYVKFKNYERKITSPFMIYADFESIQVPEDNRKQILDESYKNKYQKHIACGYGYKLVQVDDKFSKPFKSYLGEDAVYNFINSLVEESKCCSDLMKKHFNKKLVMTKEDDENFENSTKCWI